MSNALKPKHTVKDPKPRRVVNQFPNTLYYMSNVLQIAVLSLYL